MDFGVILAMASAVCGVAIGFTVAWQERRSLAPWAFVAGMVALALESVFSGLAADAFSREELIAWPYWKLLAMSLLPGCWLFFCLTYARGNYRQFLFKWRFGLIAAFLLPLALATVFR